MTKQQLIERLRLYDEVTILELLGLTGDDIIDAFLDKIDERMEYIHNALEDPTP